MKRIRLSIVVALVALAGAAIPFAWARVAPSAARRIPTARVRRGPVQITVYTTGELRAGRSAQLLAPPLGGNLQIVKLAPSGAPVKAGEVVVEFDAAEQEFALEQARLDLAQAEQQLAKADAEAAVQAAEDEVALLHAKYDVRRAELDASGNELDGAIKAQQNLLLLGEAKERYAQIEKDLKSHQETTAASANVAREKRAKAQLAVQVAEKNIASLEIRAPFDGFAVFRQNMDAMGGFCCAPGMMLPEFRVGDSVGSGRTIGDVIDTSHIEVGAKVTEQDRANVSVGQAVEVAVNALPDTTLHGTVRTVGGVASRQMFSADSARKFDITFDVGGNTRVRPGATAQISIAGPMLADALYIPRQAVFDLAGKPTVYVKTGDTFDARDVKVHAWTDSLAVVENLTVGTEVALTNPTLPAGRSRTPAAAPSQRASR
jgi:multidrug efflux pump subunit AcrA (membrane-fusion protein)